MSDDNVDTWGCFRCGTINGPIHKHEVNGLWICDECGEDSVIGFITALDIINDMFLKGHFNKMQAVDEEFEFEISDLLEEEQDIEED